MHIKALKDLRKAAGLTLEDIAREVGATRQTVSKWELGLCWPSAAVMPKLAALLHCSLEDLYAGENPEDPSPVCAPVRDDTGGRAGSDAGPYTETL